MLKKFIPACMHVHVYNRYSDTFGELNPYTWMVGYMRVNVSVTCRHIASVCVFLVMPAVFVDSHVLQSAKYMYVCQILNMDRCVRGETTHAKWQDLPSFL